MVVSLSGCGCYLDLSPGNNKGTLCSSVWHHRPTWMGKDRGGKEGWESVKKAMTSRRGKEKKGEKRKKESSSFLAKTAVEKKSERGELGSHRVNTCWEIADSLAVRDYCHIKNTVKIKETGPAELMGSQLGLPGG